MGCCRTLNPKQRSLPFLETFLNIFSREKVPLRRLTWNRCERRYRDASLSLSFFRRRRFLFFLWLFNAAFFLSSCFGVHTQTTRLKCMHKSILESLLKRLLMTLCIEDDAFRTRFCSLTTTTTTTRFSWCFLKTQLNNNRPCRRRSNSSGTPTVRT